MIFDLSPNLPALKAGWKWIKLGDVCETTSGGTPSRKISRYYEGKIPWIKSGELNYNIITDAEEKITNEAIQSSSAKIFPKSTLLIALYGATVGRLAFLGINAATNQAVAAIFTPDNLSNEFLYWFLFSYREKLLKQRIGGAQPNISQGTLKNIPIPLPPLSEQKKIVKKIEKLFTELEGGVASLKKTKEQIKLYRQSVLSAAFSGRLGRDKSRLVPTFQTDEQTGNNLLRDRQEVGGNEHLPYKQGVKMIAEPNEQYETNQLPEGLPDDLSAKANATAEALVKSDWKWVKLEEVSNKIQYGFTESATTEPIGPKFLRITDIQNGNVLWNEVPFCKIPDDLKYKYLLNEGDIVFARTGATVGKSFLITGQIPESIFASYLIRIQLSDEVNKKFVYFFFQSNNYWHQISEGQVGIGQPNVNGTKLSKLIIPICSLSQQTQIVEEIEKRFSEAHNIEKAIDDSLSKTEILRQSILKNAFEGRLV